MFIHNLEIVKEGSVPQICHFEVDLEDKKIYKNLKYDRLKNPIPSTIFALLDCEEKFGLLRLMIRDRLIKALKCILFKYTAA